MMARLSNHKDGGGIPVDTRFAGNAVPDMPGQREHCGVRFRIIVPQGPGDPPGNAPFQLR